MVKYSHYKQLLRAVLTLVFQFFVIHSLLAQLNYEEYEGEKASVTIVNQFTYSYLYDYQINAIKDSFLIKQLSPSIPEGALIFEHKSDFQQNTDEEVNFKIFPITKLVVHQNQKKHCLIKYKTVSNEVFSSELVMTLILKNDQWEKTQNLSKEITALIDIVSFCDVNMIFEFYNRQENADYPQINLLKKEAKGVNGDIDVNKMREVVVQNKEKLRAYLEN